MQDPLSYSSLKAFAKSPNHYLQYKESKPVTPALSFGIAVHCYILEYQKFERNYLIAPDVDRRTKAGKEAWQEFTEHLEGKTAVTQSDFEAIQRLSDAVWNNNLSRELLEGSQREIYGQAEIDGIQFRGYADALRPDTFAVDLKTCRDSSPDAFMRDAYNADYHLQAAIYGELFNIDRFYWIAVEKEEPTNVSVFMQSEEALRRAKTRMRQLIAAYKAWDGQPVGYSSQIITLDLPRWA